MRLSGRAKLAGVMGWPITHSRSPRLHGHWLARYAIDGAYVPLAVPPDRLATALRTLPALGFRGCNLTAPHKEAALGIMDQMSATAERIGAVNTVIVQEDGGLFGDNTDAYGFRENLTHAVPSWTAAAGPAVLIGAGGAARAVLVALMDAGASQLRITNRTPHRASALAQEFGRRVEVVPWAERSGALADARLLVNTTSLGMDGQPPLDIALDQLPVEALVADIVYVPLATLLIVAARRRGNPVVDGLGMLLHQARPGFRAWFGVDPAVDDALRAAVLAD